MKITVHACTQVVVNDPETGKPLGAKPVQVEDAPYWRSRAREGVVEIVEPKAPAGDPAGDKSGS